MPEENITQTNTTTYDEVTKDPDQVSENEVGESEEAGTEKQGGTTANEGKDETPKQQDRATNAKFAKQRREAEAKEKAEKETQERLKKEAELKGFIDGSGGKNTYIDLPIEDEEDRHLFELMKKADADGLDPVKDGYRLQREERLKAKAEKAERERIEAENAKAKEDSINAAKNNIEALSKAHPECDLAWFKEQWANNLEFKDMITKHNYTPLEAAEKLNLVPKQAGNSTPSNINGGSKKEKSILDMDDDEFERHWKSKYGTD